MLISLMWLKLLKTCIQLNLPYLPFTIGNNGRKFQVATMKIEPRAHI